MPRKPAADLDAMEHEIDATAIALEVNPNAAPFVGATRDFDENLPALRQRGRDLDRQRLRVHLTRDLINRTTDAACTDFAADLRHQVKGDRNHPEYKLHFVMPPSVFIRQDFNDQIRSVKAWLAINHPALAPYKEVLAQAVAGAEALIVTEAELDKSALALKADIEAEAGRLTAKRDALHRRLGDHAEANGLDRTWADGFFLRG